MHPAQRLNFPGLEGMGARASSSQPHAKLLQSLTKDVGSCSSCQASPLIHSRAPAPAPTSILPLGFLGGGGRGVEARYYVPNSS